MVDRMGLEDGELALAEIVWQKAERAMQGLPIQEAVLLKNTNAFTPTRQAQPLTREETQFMVDLTRDFLRTAQENMQVLRQDIQYTWMTCNPDVPSTQGNFEKLNTLRTYQRQIASSLRKLEKIQHKLKKQR